MSGDKVVHHLAYFLRLCVVVVLQVVLLYLFALRRCPFREVLCAAMDAVYVTFEPKCPIGPVVLSPVEVADFPNFLA